MRGNPRRNLHDVAGAMTSDERQTPQIQRQEDLVLSLKYQIHLPNQNEIGLLRKVQHTSSLCDISHISECEVGSEWGYGTLRLQGSQLHANMSTMQISGAYK